MFLYTIFRFFDEAHTFTDPDPAALDAAGADAIRNASFHRKIVRVASAFGAIGFLLGVVFMIAMLANPGALKTGKDVLGVLFFPLIATIPGLLFGVALSCMFAPRDFLLGPVGQKWMTLIGTRSITGARIVCGLVALVVAGVPLGLFTAIWILSIQS